MLTFDQKIQTLKNYLEDVGPSYSDSFKTDILFYFDGFNPADPKLAFLHDLDFEEEIVGWVNRITSLIVMKYEEEEEGFGEFIWENSYE
jgi:hypothetical protein